MTTPTAQPLYYVVRDAHDQIVREAGWPLTFATAAEAQAEAVRLGGTVQAVYDEEV